MKVVNARRPNLKILVFVCAAALLTVPAPPALSQDQLPELVRRIKPSAVAIETFDARGEKLSRGSGFFIDVDRVVTNRHVIEGAYRAEVHLNSGHSFQVKNVIAVDAEGDVALLKVDAPLNLVHPLSLDRTSPQEGESVVVIGNPFGLEGSVTNGIVSAVRDIPGFGRIIQITAPISPGSSGSPVVNMHGQVIGVATLQITGGQSVNFAIPSERIAQLGRTAQSDTQLMSLGDLVATSGRNKRARAVEYFRDGLTFLSKDDCQQALPYFQKATEADAGYGEAWAQTGFCSEKLGRHADAIEASRKAVSIRPSPESYFNIGLANYYLKQYREAEQAYRQAIKLDPYNAADAETLVGGSPFGEGLSLWLKKSPGFLLNRVDTPILVQAIGPGSLLGEWEWFSGLTRLDRAVDFLYIPAGTHILEKPWDRMASQQTNVDWFSFWLKGDEDADPVKAEQYMRWRKLREKQAKVKVRGQEPSAEK